MKLQIRGLAPVLTLVVVIGGVGLQSPATAHHRPDHQPGRPSPSPTAAPGTPQNLTAVATSSSEITLTWEDVANESYYWIERSDDQAAWVFLAQVEANVTSYSDRDLPPSTTYYYRIQAHGQGGSSGYSNTASATTEAAPVPSPGDGCTVAKPVTWAEAMEVGCSLTYRGGKLSVRVDVVSLDDGWCVGMGCGIDPPLDAFAIGAFRSGDVYTGWLCEDRDRYLYATCTAAWTPTVPVGSSVECLGYGGMNRPFIISVSCDQT